MDRLVGHKNRSCRCRTHCYRCCIVTNQCTDVTTPCNGRVFLVGLLWVWSAVSALPLRVSLCNDRHGLLVFCERRLCVVGCLYGKNCCPCKADNPGYDTDGWSVLHKEVRCC